jgi:hypothetical protein
MHRHCYLEIFHFEIFRTITRHEFVNYELRGTIDGALCDQSTISDCLELFKDVHKALHEASRHTAGVRYTNQRLSRYRLHLDPGTEIAQ